MSMLEIKNVHKSFFTYTKPRLQAGIFHRPGARKVTSELQVLRGVDLTVEKGDVVAILGPSGSGKSTCARLAARLWDVTRGSIKWAAWIFPPWIRKCSSAITRWSSRMWCCLMTR